MQSSTSGSHLGTPVIPPRRATPTTKAKSAAERAKAYRARKKSSATAGRQADAILAVPPDHPEQPVATPPSVTPLRRSLAPALLSVAALCLAAVGVAMNGWFARSLGSSDAAGWLFLAVGVAADLVALIMPSCAAALWRSRQRTRALVGWAVWLVTFAFAVTAGIGFTSTNISDVTLARASRITPAVTAAQSALADAMTARDRECKGGVGKFCRGREAVVGEQQRAVDAAMRAVDQAADPQTEAAIRLVAWASSGVLRPAAEDFMMFRLVLLALLPQMGGILLMVGRRA
jgi:hypothetical protein